MSNVIITMPKVDPYGHCGDTSRELIRLWEKNGLIEIKYTNTPYVWWGEEGDIVLYDRPTLQWYNPNIKNKGVLWGNTVPDGGQSWIFWGRKPSFIDKIIKEQGLLSYENRSIESIFLGKVENNIQLSFRNNSSWNNVIELFNMPINGNYMFTQYEYLEKLRDSKYGLCLRGFGPKCNREIELLSLGTVPIITKDVDLTYYEPLIENKHYIRVDEPSELKNKLNSITEEEWAYISKEGHEWYLRNCSTIGSFKTTSKIINNLKKN